MKTSKTHSAEEWVMTNMQKTSKTLSAEEWVSENRWLLHQDSSTKRNILLQLHKWDVSLSKIEITILVDILYDYILFGFNMNLFTQLKLPIRSHNMILRKLYTHNPLLPKSTLEQATHSIFKNVISMWNSSQFIFQREQIYFFYESLYTLYYDLSSVEGSSQFAILSENMTEIPILLRNSTLTGYRLAMFKRIHKTILLGLFKSLCIYGHFDDIDILFHCNRVILRGKVQKWLLNVSTEDAYALWTKCPHIKQLCIDNALKWKQLRTSNANVWKWCKTEVSPEMLHIEETLDYSEEQLSILANNNIKSLHQLLKKFTKEVHCKIILNSVRAIHKYTTHTETPTSKSNSPNTFMCDYVLQYQKTCLSKCNNHPMLMKFYGDRGQDPVSILCSLIQVTSISEKHLQQWCDVHGSIPITFFVHIVKRVSTCLFIQKKKNNDLNNQSLRLLNEFNTMLQNIMKFSLCHYENIEDVLGAIHMFLCSFKDYLSLYRPTYFCRLICCLLCIYHMEQLPNVESEHTEHSVTHDSTCAICYDSTCAICYNEIQAPLKVLPCGHAFHIECMMQSVQHLPHQKKEFNCIAKCPYCMTAILPKETVNNMQCKTSQSVVKWLYDM